MMFRSQVCWLCAGVLAILGCSAERTPRTPAEYEQLAAAYEELADRAEKADDVEGNGVDSFQLSELARIHAERNWALSRGEQCTGGERLSPFRDAQLVGAHTLPTGVRLALRTEISSAQLLQRIHCFTAYLARGGRRAPGRLDALVGLPLETISAGRHGAQLFVDLQSSDPSAAQTLRAEADAPHAVAVGQAR